VTDRIGGAGGLISLPKRGGALSGLGEKFAPDLHTGTGNFTVPLALPPAGTAFSRHSASARSAGHGNGPIGLRWALSVPGETRKTSHGLPRYEIDQGTFILSGAEDLVPVAKLAAGEIRYRPRTEGLFARIRHLRVGATDHWDVDSRDGLVSLYGIPAGPGDEPARVRDPADTSRVFAWKLTQITDTFGNRIEYAYDRDSGSDSRRRWDQLYLKRIRYADYGPRIATKFLASVSFVYDEERPDPFSDHGAGFEIRTTRRCRRIEVAIDTGAGATPIRVYHFQYADDMEASSSGLSNGVSLLTGIQLEGLDGAESEKLPPLTFGYTALKPQGRKFIAVEGELPATSLADRSRPGRDRRGCFRPPSRVDSCGCKNGRHESVEGSRPSYARADDRVLPGDTGRPTAPVGPPTLILPKDRVHAFRLPPLAAGDYRIEVGGTGSSQKLVQPVHGLFSVAADVELRG